MTQRINRGDLMRLAWSLAKSEHWMRRLPAGTLCSLFPAALRQAWKQMKDALVIRAERLREAAAIGAEKLQMTIITLENKTRLGFEGQQRLRKAEDMLSVLHAHERELEGIS